MKKSLLAGLAVGVMMFGIDGIANAAIVNSISGGTITPMPILEYFGTGPQTFGSGITWSSEFEQSVFGYDIGYGFTENGSWSGSDLVMAGTNSPDSVMKFEFATPVTGVGGFLNYVPNSETAAVISVYDNTNTLIETTTLSFLTGGGDNTGVFYGFLESTAQIKYFTLSGAYIGIANLTSTESAPVPEPATMILFGTGLAGLAAARRRKNKKEVC